jgi:hypothetical protein
VDVEYRKGDRIAGDKVWLMDYTNSKSGLKSQKIQILVFTKDYFSESYSYPC